MLPSQEAWPFLINRHAITPNTMPSYIIKKEILITRQAGDSFDIVITIPSTHPMAGATIKFAIALRNMVFVLKTLEDCVVNGQELTILFQPADTRGKSGPYNWELEHTSSTGFVSTLGKGPFHAIKELIVPISE
jgi:hypothetical protein